MWLILTGRPLSSDMTSRCRSAPAPSNATKPLVDIWEKHVAESIYRSTEPCEWVSWFC